MNRDLYEIVKDDINVIVREVTGEGAYLELTIFSTMVFGCPEGL